MRRPLLTACATVLLAGALFGLARAADEPKVGDAAPAFTLKSLDGKDVSLSDFKGKVVMINWFATWCPPCNAEVPHLQKEVWAAYQKKGVQVLAIDIAERGAQESLVTEFKKKYKLTYPILLDQKATTFEAYGNGDGIPKNCLIGKDGKIRAFYVGFDPEKGLGEVTKAIDAALGEAAASSDR